MIAIITTTFGEKVGQRARDGKSVLIEDIDSLDRLNFIMQIEEEYGIDIPDAISIDMKTIDDVANYVATITRGAAHGAH